MNDEVKSIAETIRDLKRENARVTEYAEQLKTRAARIVKEKGSYDCKVDPRVLAEYERAYEFLLEIAVSDSVAARDHAMGGAQLAQTGGNSGGMPLSVGRSRPDQTATSSTGRDAGLILQRGVAPGLNPNNAGHSSLTRGESRDGVGPTHSESAALSKNTIEAQSTTDAVAQLSGNNGESPNTRSCQGQVEQPGREGRGFDSHQRPPSTSPPVSAETSALATPNTLAGGGTIYESVGFQYRFPSAMGNGYVWRDSDAPYNGHDCHGAREIFVIVKEGTAPPGVVNAEPKWVPLFAAGHPTPPVGVEVLVKNYRDAVGPGTWLGSNWRTELHTLTHWAAKPDSGNSQGNANG